MICAHPILSCSQSMDFEQRHLGGVEAEEWKAMNRAGQSLGLAILSDYREVGPVPESLRVLALLGKGHNAGDALIACEEILKNSGQRSGFEGLHYRYWPLS